MPVQVRNTLAFYGRALSDDFVKTFLVLTLLDMNRLFLFAFASIGLAFSAHAAAVNYDFTVTIANGPLADEQYVGSTTFDTALTIASDNSNFDVVSQPAVSFNFLGELFTEASDIEFTGGILPRAVFFDGNFLGLDYVVDESDFVANPVDIPGEIVFLIFYSTTLITELNQNLLMIIALFI